MRISTLLCGAILAAACSSGSSSKGAPAGASTSITGLMKARGLAEADVEMCKERAAWMERMQKKAYVSGSQVDAERVRLKRAVTELEKLTRKLESIAPQKPPG